MSVAARISAKKRNDIAGLQYAALPYCLSIDRRLEILLITSRRTRRWIIPKGWPIEGLTPWDCAAREALEEAGVSGEVHQESIGYYHYFKQLKNNISIPCKVEVYALRVTRRRQDWAEKDERDLRWCSVSEAVALVNEPELPDLLLEAAAKLMP
jgi:8-oxo-dGTP pyrophosphatase MutT (NUDIX family)